MDFDVLTIGDYSLDVILNIPNESARSNIENTEKEICLLQDQKILADQFHVSLGGNACNVSVGLSRLGFKCSYQTFIGDDYTAEMLKTEMKNEQVDLKLAVKRSGMAGNYSTSLIYQKEKTIIIYNPENEYSLPPVSSKKLIFISSVGNKYQRIFSDVCRFVSDTSISLAFNPATHQLENNLETYKNILEKTTFLFVNKHEAGKILKDTTVDIKKTLLDLNRLGPKVVVLTEGVKGSYVYAENKFFHCPIYDIPVVQKTGAGDAFASGYLGAILLGIDEFTALKYGTFNAAGVAQAFGPHEGLLGINEMNDLLQKHPEIRITEI